MTQLWKGMGEVIWMSILNEHSLPSLPYTLAIKYPLRPNKIVAKNTSFNPSAFILRALSRIEYIWEWSTDYSCIIQRWMYNIICLVCMHTNCLFLLYFFFYFLYIFWIKTISLRAEQFSLQHFCLLAGVTRFIYTDNPYTYKCIGLFWHTRNYCRIFTRSSSECTPVALQGRFQMMMWTLHTFTFFFFYIVFDNGNL